MIHPPADVAFVCLSATVSNAVELGGLDRRGSGTDRRPSSSTSDRSSSTPLYFVGDRIAERDHLFPLLVDGRPNPEGHRFDADGPAARPARPGAGRRFFTPASTRDHRTARDEALLPAIYFIFSRAGCDDAAMAVLDAGLRLTDGRGANADPRDRGARTAALTDADLDVLGYDRGCPPSRWASRRTTRA